MAGVRCPHCGAENDVGVDAPARCVACGRELAAAPTPPAAADAERRRKARGEAAGLLFAVAAIQLMCGVAVLGLSGFLARGEQQQVDVTLPVAQMLALAAVYAGLGWWAMSRPLLPAILGLVLYVLLSAAGIIVTYNETGDVPPVTSIVLFLFVAVALSRGVWVAWRADRPG